MSDIVMEIDSYSSIRLITRAEWENILASVPNVPVETTRGWWTATKLPNCSRAIYVMCSGEVSSTYIDKMSGIRPLFIFENASAKVLKPGDKVAIGKFRNHATVIDVKYDGSTPVVYALSDLLLGLVSFRGHEKYLQGTFFRDTAGV